MKTTEGKQRFTVSFEIEVPDDATWDEVDAFATYHVIQNGSLRGRPTDWEWKPIRDSLLTSLR